MPRRKQIPLSGQIILGMILGAALGLLIGEKAAPLGELGKLAIQLIKAAAAPLLFLAIVKAILEADLNLTGGLKMLAVATFNASIALAIGLGISNLFQGGRHLQAMAVPLPANGAVASGNIDILKTLASYIPSNFIDPFAQNLIIPIVLIAIFLGMALRRVRIEHGKDGLKHYTVLEDGVITLYRVMEIILGWLVKLAPIAVFGVVAKTVGQYGLAPFRGLGIYVGLGLTGMAFHMALTYQLWIALYAKINLKRFWKTAKEALIYSFGANSSLATLPLTLKALDTLGVSKGASALGACIGTNLNNDGIILYEGMAMLFVAQAHGIDLSMSQQFIAALFCLVAAMGVAGVPEAGFVSLALVLTTVGLPTEILPLLLTVDWILARARSVVNVASDMTTSIILDRWGVKDPATVKV